MYILYIFNVGKATALKTVRRVAKAIVNLSPLFIKWSEGERAQEIFKGFATCSAFPNVIGAIDGTHINTKAPHSNPKCCVNRKGYHSIHLQVTYVSIRWEKAHIYIINYILFYLFIIDYF